MEAYRDSAELVKYNKLEAELRSKLDEEREDHQQAVTSFEKSIRELQETAERNWRNTLMLLASMLVLALVAIIALFRKKNQLKKLNFPEKSRERDNVIRKDDEGWCIIFNG